MGYVSLNSGGFLMRAIHVFLVTFLFSAAASAQSHLECTHYIYNGVPFVTITMKVLDNSQIERLAELTHYGNTQQIAVEENETREGQLYNLTVDADRPGQELYLEILLPPTNEAGHSYAAKLINPQSPAMKEMAGQCELAR